MAHAVYIRGNSRDFGFAERTLRRLADREPFDSRDDASLDALGGFIEGDLERETVGSERRFVETHCDAEGQHGELRDILIYSERGETLHPNRGRQAAAGSDGALLR